MVVRGRILAIALLCASRSVGAQPTRSVAGIVRDSSGMVIENVELELFPGGIRARSGSDGVYRLFGATVGLNTVSARRLGYSPVVQAISVDSLRDRRLDIVLIRTVETLSGVTVNAKPEVYESRLAGFNARSTKQVGHFVTRERIDRANSTTLSDMLREIPGVRVIPIRNQGRVVRIRGSSCPPLVYVDGFPAAAGEFDVDIIDLKSVEGIEVYSGLGSVPPEFTSARDLDRCGVIAIWSRPARPRSRSVQQALSSIETSLTDVKTATEVDTPARLESASVIPRYPDSLLVAGVSGRVVIEVVVDTAGVVERESFEVLASTDARFTAAVRDALLTARFTPGLLKGHKVRQFVQLPYNFKPSSPTP